MMTDLGFRPRVPINATDFADEAKRKAWIEEKGMMVFTFINPQNPLETRDQLIPRKNSTRSRPHAGPPGR